MGADGEIPEWGGEIDEKLSTKAFLRKAEIHMNKMGKTTDQYVDTMRLFYKEGTRAETWHSELSEEQTKTGWEGYRKLLLEEFPSREIVTSKAADCHEVPLFPSLFLS